MSWRPMDRFEAEIRPLGDATALLLARRDGLGSDTCLYRNDDDRARFTAIAAPERIHALATGGGRWVAVTGDTIHESRGTAAAWTGTPLGSAATWAAAAVVGDEIWVAGGDRIVVLCDGTLETRWRLAARDREAISEMIPRAAGGVLVTSSTGRILRARGADRELEDWSQGLPALPAGAGSPTIGRVDDAWLAFFDGLHARRDEDPAWIAVQPDGPPDGSWLDALRWLAPTESAQWVALPWRPSEYLGTDGASLFIGGAGRPLAPVWRRPDGRTSVKQLAAGPAAVYASLRNATVATAGVAVHPHGVRLLSLA